MSTPDITKAIPSNDIKNGASLLLVNKTGTEVLFDSSRDTEQGPEALAPATTDRFDDREYYLPLTSSPGTSSTDTLDNVTDRGAITTNGITVGSLTLSQGSILSETNNTVSLMPPTAASGQSLVIRPTAAVWTMNSSGYIVYGSPITISVTLQSWSYFGTVNYVISGSGVTEQSLGRALTGKLTFVSTNAPDGESITWTIPANSTISQFTLTLTSVDGTRSTDEQTQNDPALYYDFEENAMPIGQFVTVTNNGISGSEHSHVHLVSGNPSTVDIYLGDDDQYVKIEKNAGDVVIGTSSNTRRWTFGTDGSLTLPASGNIISGTNTPQVGYRAVFTQDLYGNTDTGLVSGSTVLDVGSNAQLLALLNPSTGYGNAQFLLYNNITITYSNNTTQTFSDCRCTNINGSVFSLGYGATTAGHNFPITLQTSNYAAATPAPQWIFGTDGELTLPTSGSITFSNNTTQTSAGVPSNTGLVPNSASITNMISISQSDYDAIVTKDSSTLYVIS